MISDTSSSPSLLVVGGGAAGYFAAIHCAENNPDAQVTLVEASKKPLGKVRISGGGRCNVTHAMFDPKSLCQNYPRGSRELRGPFTRFQPNDTVDWFQAHGVELKQEPDGRMFPVTDSSETIIQCLEDTARAAGVKIKLGVKVRRITSNPAEETSRFAAQFSDQSTEHFDRVLLATGSAKAGYDIAALFGHTIVPPVPSLFTFTIPDPCLEDLQGLSFPDVALTLKTSDNDPLLKERGPLLITHWGLSGPAVLKLSAWGARQLYDAHYSAELLVNWIPEYNEQSAQNPLMSLKARHPTRMVSNCQPFELPKRFWARLLELAFIPDDLVWAEFSKDQARALARALTSTKLHVRAKGEFKEEFVTCGGVALNEVEFSTMESKKIPGLFFAGEILDIDGITGGFNFQSAWTTGAIAAAAMAS